MIEAARRWNSIHTGPFRLQNKKGAKPMRIRAIAIAGAAVAMLSVGACNKSNGGNGPKDVQSKQAQKAAGGKTIAAGLPANSKFMAAAKTAGLDQTLAGPGPYTVF